VDDLSNRFCDVEKLELVDVIGRGALRTAWSCLLDLVVLEPDEPEPGNRLQRTLPKSQGLGCYTYSNHHQNEAVAQFEYQY